MPEDFVHLHVHSEYSLLDGLGRISPLIKRTAELGQPALALTDHGTMHGAIEFVRAARKEGVKPILGVEAYITQHGRPLEGRDPERDKNRHHVLLLAQNMTGYRHLLEICTKAQLEGFYYRPRIDADYLAAHSEGIICTSGCLAAELPTLLRNGNEAKALERLQWYRDVFGPDHWYIEFQEHDLPELTQVNKQLFAFAHQYDLPMIVTNDVHYVKEEEAPAHDMLLCVQTSALVSQKDRMRMSSNSYFLKSLEQMRATFLPQVDLPASAFSNTVKIAEMCDVDPDDQSYHLPDIAIPDGYNYQSYLRHLTEEGLRWRYGANADDPAVRTRTEHELKTIHEMGFDVYYLIVWDLCMYAKRRGIWWNVRGSGAGSIVAYAMGVTNLDPLRNKLIFERFLNPSRVTMPDFDLDFPDDQREELIRYTLDKFGSEQVAQVVTFGRMKARAAVRDVGRAMDVPLADVDRIAKMIPAIPGKPVTIREVLTEGHEFYSAELRDLYQGTDHVRQLLDTASSLEGVARHSSIHAAAVIVADRPLVHYTPLMRPPKSAVTGTITQYEYPILESIGLLKVDFLGLATLTLMREAARLIRERHGIEFTLENLPIDDPKIYELLSSGDVMGVFQVEGQGMRRMLMELRPTEFDHIVATISLYRPGPMEFIPDFISVLHGEKKAQFVHPILKPIMEETMGVCVSGDARVIDAGTGRPYRLDKLGDVPELTVQGVNEDGRPAVGRITHWINSGHKPVYEVTLRNGAHIKVTADHRLLTEDGWRPLNELKPGDYIGTPPVLFGATTENSLAADHRRLRTLAYLIADGSLTSGTLADFVSKDTAMLAEYERCLAAFDSVLPTFTDQVHGVTRIGAAKDRTANLPYHTPNGLLAWLRELGLKYPSGSNPGGAHSRDKSVPEFVFELSSNDIAFFLASLWDGDGYMGSDLCHYRTISPLLAEDVRLLLLRLGIASTIHQSYYTIAVKAGESPERRASYQVTVYDTSRLASLLQPHMVSAKRMVDCQGTAAPTVSRAAFMRELDVAWSGTKKALMREHGLDRQHFRAHSQARARTPSRVVRRVAHALDLPLTQRNLDTLWQKIVSIEPAGVEHVYDLTVEGLHSFVANGIIVHNCVYQEQVIQILTDVAGYTPGEADLVRRGISKKAKKVLDEHREIFAVGAARVSGLSRAESDEIWDAVMGFARYGFNRAHAADYAVIVAQTAYLKAYYPVEYMAALLTVERHDTEKVGLLIAECRRMGVEVLPPNVNVSSNNFTIEQMPAGGVAPRQQTIFQFPIESGTVIRMGLDAIKNVGEGPVEQVLKARHGQAFASLSEFAERVDLRQINRRGLECLIKVGALSDFGERADLLAAIDRIMSASSSSHEAREIGQLTLFGGSDEGGSEDLLQGLTNVTKVTPKEALEWEKELVGVYVSSHPLQKMTVELINVVTHSTAEITEEMHKLDVVIAGLIADVRQITTKKGDAMAFVRLEDLQGVIEVTVFPHLYHSTRLLWTPEKIVIVTGKVDVRNGRVGVAADSARDYVEGRTVIEDTSSVSYRYRNGQIAGRPQLREKGAPSAPAMRPAPLPVRATAAAEAFPPAPDDDQGPFMGEENPFAADEPGWLEDEQDLGAGAGAPQLRSDNIEARGPGAASVVASTQPLPVVPPTVAVATTLPEDPVPAAGPAPLEPTPVAGPRTLRIVFRRSQSLEGDRRRLEDLVNLLSGYQGEDHFLIVLEASAGTRYQLDFPNNHTRICRELQQELTQRLGSNTWQVDGP